MSLLPVCVRLLHVSVAGAEGAYGISALVVREKDMRLFSRALKTLFVLVVGYGVAIPMLSLFILRLNFVVRPTDQKLLDANSQDPWWWSLFHTISAFNNAGFALFPDSLVQFSKSPVVLIAMTVLVLVGNTAFPLLLRAIVWALSKMPWLDTEVYCYILDNSRRCFTVLFDWTQTAVLAFVLVLFNGAQLFFNLVLDWNKDQLDELPPAYRVLNSVFQSVSTRTAGLNSLDLSLAAPSIKVLYVIMMFIAIFPIAVSLRRTNVKFMHSTDPINSFGKSLLHQTQVLLARDIGFVALIVFLVCIVENDTLSTDPDFTNFKVIFEVISAYGTVGYSLGYPGIPQSFCGKFSTLSKLLLILTMLLGRHRGLPGSVDPAFTLPRELVMQAVNTRMFEVKPRPHRMESDTDKSDTLPSTRPPGQPVPVSASHVDTAPACLVASALPAPISPTPHITHPASTACEPVPAPAPVAVNLQP